MLGILLGVISFGEQILWMCHRLELHPTNVLSTYTYYTRTIHAHALNLDRFVIEWDGNKIIHIDDGEHYAYLQVVAAWILEEHCPLLRRLPAKPQGRLYDEICACSLHTCSKLIELRLCQHYSKVRDWYL